MNIKKLIISIFILIEIFFLGFILYDLQYNTKETNDAIAYVAKPPITNNAYKIVQKKDDISDELVDIANEEINKLPKEIIDKFIESGWTIYLTNEDINETQFNNKYASVIGATLFNEKTILISANTHAIKESLLHEIGHFVDYMTGYTSGSDYFINNIYNIEEDEFKKNISNSKCVSNEHELFAEEFSYIFIDQNKCTPLALTYIKNIINNI